MMIHNELVPSVAVAKQSQTDTAHYKLINGSPSAFNYNNLRKRKSYAMSFNKETNNAEWVYEILNEDTLKKNDLKEKGSPYHRGHLASGCQSQVVSGSH